MGAVCCCFHVPDVEHNNNNDNSSSEDNSDDSFVRKFMNKIRWSFHKEQVEPIPSTSQQSSSSSSLISDDTSQQSSSSSSLISDGLISNLSENSTSQQASSLIWGELMNNLSENSQTERVVENAEDWYDHECPTCLEEYTIENPKIILKCSHQYHLGCIYEWMERSKNCPVCGKLMLFDESS